MFQFNSKLKFAVALHQQEKILQFSIFFWTDFISQLLLVRLRRGLRVFRSIPCDEFASILRVQYLNFSTRTQRYLCQMELKISQVFLSFLHLLVLRANLHLKYFTGKTGEEQQIDRPTILDYARSSEHTYDETSIKKNISPVPVHLAMFSINRFITLVFFH